MSVKIISKYEKRLGLPFYSSHQFSVSVETELNDLNQVKGEISRLYEFLQNSVDQELIRPGFVPDEQYGKPALLPISGNGNGSTHLNGNGHFTETRQNGSHDANRWQCSTRQKEFLLKIIADNDLTLDSVEEIAFDRFGSGLSQLSKMKASALIEELLSTYQKNDRAPSARK